MEAIARRMQVALDTSDLAAFQELLDPAVTWGPPYAKNPGCKSRDEVLAWYRRSKSSGVEGRVSEVEVLGECVLLGLVVRGTEAARERGGAALRWQVNTVRNGRVVEIVGFDGHAEALAYAEAKPRYG
jgi:SnoaL-like domain